MTRMLPVALLAGTVLVGHPGWAQTPAAPPSASSTPTAPRPDAAPNNPASAGATATATPQASPAREVSVANLTDKDLKGQNDSDLGDIDRVVENKAEKKPYVVVSRGGVLGFFEKQYLVPVEQIAISGDRVVAKNMTQAQLESSPTFVDDTGTYRTLDANQRVPVPELR